ncbi:MAG: low temperature requirement protein A [Acidimicrobiia bacterium]
MKPPVPAGADVHAHTQTVGWLELFFDLVVVAAVVAFSDAISSHPTVENLFWVAAAFVGVWLVWFGTVFCFNQDRREEAWDRAIVVAAMVALSVGAIAVGEGPSERRYLVGTAYVVMLVALAMLNLRASTVNSQHRQFILERAVLCGLAAVMIGGSMVFPPPWHIAGWWSAIALVGLLWFAHAWRSRSEIPPVDTVHLAERMGLLTIIVLGEAFVKLAIVASGEAIDFLDVSVVVAMFLSVFGVFWVYFDDVPRAGIAESPLRRFFYFTGHVVMQAACVGLAIGMAGLIVSPHGVLSIKVATLSAGSLATIYLGCALIGPGTRRVGVARLTILRIATAGLLLATIPVLLTVEWVGPVSTAFALAVVVLVHGALAQRLRDNTSTPPGFANASAELSSEL